MECFTRPSMEQVGRQCEYEPVACCKRLQSQLLSARSRRNTRKCQFVEENIFVVKRTCANNPLPISEHEMRPIRAKDICVLLILPLTREAFTVEN